MGHIRVPVTRSLFMLLVTWPSVGKYKTPKSRRRLTIEIENSANVNRHEHVWPGLCRLEARLIHNNKCAFFADDIDKHFCLIYSVKVNFETTMDAAHKILTVNQLNIVLVLPS